MGNAVGNSEGEFVVVMLDDANHELLSSVAADVFDFEINPLYLSDFLADPRHLMFVAVANQTVVGMASAIEYFHPDKPRQLFINEVGVAPPYRRIGIGRALVDALIAAGKERGCTYAWLGTATDNVAGQACFSSITDVETAQPFLLYEWDLEV